METTGVKNEQKRKKLERTVHKNTTFNKYESSIFNKIKTSYMI